MSVHPKWPDCAVLDMLEKVARGCMGPSHVNLNHLYSPISSTIIRGSLDRLCANSFSPDINETRQQKSKEILFTLQSWCALIGKQTPTCLPSCTVPGMPSTRILLSAGAACLLGMSGYAYISNNSWFFENIALPIVARVDPERAHIAAVYIASKGLAPRDLGKDPPILVLKRVGDSCDKY